MLEQELAAELSEEAFHGSAREGEMLQDIDRWPLTLTQIKPATNPHGMPWHPLTQPWCPIECARMQTLQQ